jgi:bud site selection protein 20
MGRLRRSRTHHARRDVARAARTRVHTKDLDQIQHDMEHNRKKLEVQPIDEDKPGLGQHVS